MSPLVQPEVDSIQMPPRVTGGPQPQLPSNPVVLTQSPYRDVVRTTGNSAPPPPTSQYLTQYPEMQPSVVRPYGPSPTHQQQYLTQQDTWFQPQSSLTHAASPPYAPQYPSYPPQHPDTNPATQSQTYTSSDQLYHTSQTAYTAMTSAQYGPAPIYPPQQNIPTQPINTPRNSSIYPQQTQQFTQQYVATPWQGSTPLPPLASPTAPPTAPQYSHLPEARPEQNPSRKRSHQFKTKKVSGDKQCKKPRNEQSSTSKDEDCSYCVNQTCLMKASGDPCQPFEVKNHQTVNKILCYAQPRSLPHNRVALFTGTSCGKEVVFLCDVLIQHEDDLYILPCGAWVEDPSNDEVLGTIPLSINRPPLKFKRKPFHRCAALLEKRGEAAYSWATCQVGEETWNMHLAQMKSKCFDASGRFRSCSSLSALMGRRLVSNPANTLNGRVYMSSARWISISTNPPSPQYAATASSGPSNGAISAAPSPFGVLGLGSAAPNQGVPPEVSQQVAITENPVSLSSSSATSSPLPWVCLDCHWVVPSDILETVNLRDNGRTVQSWAPPQVFLADMGFNTCRDGFFEIQVDFSHSRGGGVGASTKNRVMCLIWHPQQREPPVNKSEEDANPYTVTVQLVHEQGTTGKIYFYKSTENCSEETSWLPLPPEPLYMFPTTHLFGHGDRATLVSPPTTPENQTPPHHTERNRVNVAERGSSNIASNAGIPALTSSSSMQHDNAPHGNHVHKDVGGKTSVDKQQQDGMRKEPCDSNQGHSSHSTGDREAPVTGADGTGSQEGPTAAATAAPMTSIGETIRKELHLKENCRMECISDEGSRKSWRLTLQDYDLDEATRHRLVSLVPGDVLWFLGTSLFGAVTTLSDLSVMWTCASCSYGDAVSAHLEKLELSAPFSEDCRSKVRVQLVEQPGEPGGAVYHTEITVTKRGLSTVRGNLGLSAAMRLLVLISQHDLLRSAIQEETVFQCEVDFGLGARSYRWEPESCTVHVEDLCLFGLPLRIDCQFTLGGKDTGSEFITMRKAQVPLASAAVSSATQEADRRSNAGGSVDLCTVLCSMSVPVSDLAKQLLEQFVLQDYKLFLLLPRGQDGASDDASSSFALALNLQVSTEDGGSDANNCQGCIVHHATKTAMAVELENLYLSSMMEELCLEGKLPADASTTSLEWLYSSAEASPGSIERCPFTKSSQTSSDICSLSPSQSRKISRLLLSDAASSFCVKIDVSSLAEDTYSLFDCQARPVSAKYVFSDGEPYLLCKFAGFELFAGVGLQPGTDETTFKINSTSFTGQTTFHFAWGLPLRATMEVERSAHLLASVSLDFDGHPATEIPLPFSLPQFKCLAAHGLRGEVEISSRVQSFTLGCDVRAVWTDGQQPEMEAALHVVVGSGGIPTISTGYLSCQRITMGSLVRLVTGCSHKDVAFLDQVFPDVTDLQLLFKMDGHNLGSIPSLSHSREGSMDGRPKFDGKPIDSSPLVDLVKEKTGRADFPLVDGEEKCIAIAGHLSWLGIDASVLMYCSFSAGAPSRLQIHLVFPKGIRCRVGQVAWFEAGEGTMGKTSLDLYVDTVIGKAYFDWIEDLQLLPTINAVRLRHQIDFEARKGSGASMKISAGLALRGTANTEENTVKAVNSSYEAQDNEIVLRGHMEATWETKLPCLRVLLGNVSSTGSVATVILGGLKKCVGGIFDVCDEALKRANDIVSPGAPGCNALPRGIRDLILLTVCMAESVETTISKGYDLITSMLQQLTPDVLDVRSLCVDGWLSAGGNDFSMIGVDACFDVGLFGMCMRGSIRVNFKNLLYDLCKKLVQLLLCGGKAEEHLPDAELEHRAGDGKSTYGQECRKPDFQVGFTLPNNPLVPIHVKLSDEYRIVMCERAAKLSSLIQEIKVKLPERVDEEAFHTLPETDLMDPLLLPTPTACIVCPHCGQRAPSSGLPSHLKQCIQLAEVECPECGEKVRIIDKERHMAEACSKRPTHLLVCIFCHTEIDAAKIQEHQNLSCHGNFKCPSCGEQIRRRALVSHLKSCRGEGARLELCEKCNYLKELPHNCSLERFCSNCQRTFETAAKHYCSPLTQCVYCNRQIAVEAIATHESSECVSVPVFCEDCRSKLPPNSNYSASRKRSDHSTRCPSALVTCFHCVQSFSRSTMRQHKRDCQARREKQLSEFLSFASTASEGLPAHHNSLQLFHHVVGKFLQWREGEAEKWKDKEKEEDGGITFLLLMWEFLLQPDLANSKEKVQEFVSLFNGRLAEHCRHLAPWLQGPELLPEHNILPTIPEFVEQGVTELSWDKLLVVREDPLGGLQGAFGCSVVTSAPTRDNYIIHFLHRLIFKMSNYNQLNVPVEHGAGSSTPLLHPVDILHCVIQSSPYDLKTLFFNNIDLCHQPLPFMLADGSVLLYNLGQVQKMWVEAGRVVSCSLSRMHAPLVGFLQTDECSIANTFKERLINATFFETEIFSEVPGNLKHSQGCIEIQTTCTRERSEAFNFNTIIANMRPGCKSTTNESFMWSQCDFLVVITTWTAQARARFTAFLAANPSHVAFCIVAGENTQREEIDAFHAEHPTNFHVRHLEGEEGDSMGLASKKSTVSAWITDEVGRAISTLNATQGHSWQTLKKRVGTNCTHSDLEHPFIKEAFKVAKAVVSLMGCEEPDGAAPLSAPDNDRKAKGPFHEELTPLARKILSSRHGNQGTSCSRQAALKNAIKPQLLEPLHPAIQAFISSVIVLKTDMLKLFLDCLDQVCHREEADFSVNWSNLLKEITYFCEAFLETGLGGDGLVGALTKKLAELVFQGCSYELINEHSGFNTQCTRKVFDHIGVCIGGGDKPVFVVATTMGAGNSTLLSTMFNRNFWANTEKRTPGIRMQILRAERTLTAPPLSHSASSHSVSTSKAVGREYHIMVLDTEGLAADDKPMVNYDNELVTFLTTIADVAIVNCTNPGDISTQRFLEVSCSSIMRLKKSLTLDMRWLLLCPPACDMGGELTGASAITQIGTLEDITQFDRGRDVFFVSNFLGNSSIHPDHIKEVLNVRRSLLYTLSTKENFQTIGTLISKISKIFPQISSDRRDPPIQQPYVSPSKDEKCSRCVQQTCHMKEIDLFQTFPVRQQTVSDISCYAEQRFSAQPIHTNTHLQVYSETTAATPVKPIQIILIGNPGTGKSTILNSLFPDPCQAFRLGMA
ncbi:hypothetical protein Pelo_16943 [Pelomyxa schiedti]|nr:hypothetical protein Pelo_16943 [Pelomyxa schiedti]